MSYFENHPPNLRGIYVNHPLTHPADPQGFQSRFLIRFPPDAASNLDD
jgi:hypothetical protein